MFDRGLLIGRFQPFHNGHMSIVKHILGECREIIIGIGSAQTSHTKDNPFTAGERHLMISEAMKEAGYDNYFLVPIEDLHRHAIWVAHVKSLVPPFDVYYTNNPLDRRLFEEAGCLVRSTLMLSREEYSGTHIRHQMATGGNWKENVPSAVARVMEKIDGVGRMIALVATDEFIRG
ncbi:MAG: nicotinamide-nucleotide adenylyltransferase [Thermoplasmata archaeon]